MCMTSVNDSKLSHIPFTLVSDRHYYLDSLKSFNLVKTPKSTETLYKKNLLNDYWNEKILLLATENNINNPLTTTDSISNYRALKRYNSDINQNDSTHLCQSNVSLNPYIDYIAYSSITNYELQNEQTNINNTVLRNKKFMTGKEINNSFIYLDVEQYNFPSVLNESSISRDLKQDNWEKVEKAKGNWKQSNLKNLDNSSKSFITNNLMKQDISLNSKLTNIDLESKLTLTKYLKSQSLSKKIKISHNSYIIYPYSNNYNDPSTMSIRLCEPLCDNQCNLDILKPHKIRDVNEFINDQYIFSNEISSSSDMDIDKYKNYGYDFLSYKNNDVKKNIISHQTDCQLYNSESERTFPKGRKFFWDQVVISPLKYKELQSQIEKVNSIAKNDFQIVKNVSLSDYNGYQSYIKNYKEQNQEVRLVSSSPESTTFSRNIKYFLFNTPKPIKQLNHIKTKMSPYGECKVLEKNDSMNNERIDTSSLFSKIKNTTDNSLNIRNFIVNTKPLDNYENILYNESINDNNKMDCSISNISNIDYKIIETSLENETKNIDSKEIIETNQEACVLSQIFPCTHGSTRYNKADYIEVNNCHNYVESLYTDQLSQYDYSTDCDIRRNYSPYNYLLLNKEEKYKHGIKFLSLHKNNKQVQNSVYKLSKVHRRSKERNNSCVIKLVPEQLPLFISPTKELNRIVHNSNTSNKSQEFSIKNDRIIKPRLNLSAKITNNNNYITNNNNYITNNNNYIKELITNRKEYKNSSTSMEEKFKCNNLHTSKNNIKYGKNIYDNNETKITASNILQNVKFNLSSENEKNIGDTNCYYIPRKHSLPVKLRLSTNNNNTNLKIRDCISLSLNHFKSLQEQDLLRYDKRSNDIVSISEESNFPNYKESYNYDKCKVSINKPISIESHKSYKKTNFEAKNKNEKTNFGAKNKNEKTNFEVKNKNKKTFDLEENEIKNIYSEYDQNLHHSPEIDIQRSESLFKSNIMNNKISKNCIHLELESQELLSSDSEVTESSGQFWIDSEYYTSHHSDLLDFDNQYKNIKSTTNIYNTVHKNYNRFLFNGEQNLYNNGCQKFLSPVNTLENLKNSSKISLNSPSSTTSVPNSRLRNIKPNNYLVHTDRGKRFNHDSEVSHKIKKNSFNKNKMKYIEPIPDFIFGGDDDSSSSYNSNCDQFFEDDIDHGGMIIKRTCYHKLANKFKPLRLALIKNENTELNDGSNDESKYMYFLKELNDVWSTTDLISANNSYSDNYDKSKLTKPGVETNNSSVVEKSNIKKQILDNKYTPEAFKKWIDSHAKDYEALSKKVGPDGIYEAWLKHHITLDTAGTNVSTVTRISGRKRSIVCLPYIRNRHTIVFDMPLKDYMTTLRTFCIILVVGEHTSQDFPPSANHIISYQPTVVPILLTCVAINFCQTNSWKNILNSLKLFFLCLTCNLISVGLQPKYNLYLGYAKGYSIILNNIHHGWFALSSAGVCFVLKVIRIITDFVVEFLIDEPVLLNNGSGNNLDDTSTIMNQSNLVTRNVLINYLNITWFNKIYNKILSLQSYKFNENIWSKNNNIKYLIRNIFSGISKTLTYFQTQKYNKNNFVMNSLDNNKIEINSTNMNCSKTKNYEKGNVEIYISSKSDISSDHQDNSTDLINLVEYKPIEYRNDMTQDILNKYPPNKNIQSTFIKTNSNINSDFNEEHLYFASTSTYNDIKDYNENKFQSNTINTCGYSHRLISPIMSNSNSQKPYNTNNEKISSDNTLLMDLTNQVDFITPCLDSINNCSTPLDNDINSVVYESDISMESVHIPLLKKYNSSKDDITQFNNVDEDYENLDEKISNFGIFNIRQKIYFIISFIRFNIKRSVNYCKSWRLKDLTNLDFYKPNNLKKYISYRYEQKRLEICRLVYRQEDLIKESTENIVSQNDNTSKPHSKGIINEIYILYSLALLVVAVYLSINIPCALKSKYCIEKPNIFPGFGELWLIREILHCVSMGILACIRVIIQEYTAKRYSWIENKLNYNITIYHQTARLLGICPSLALINVFLAVLFNIVVLQCWTPRSVITFFGLRPLLIAFITFTEYKNIFSLANLFTSFNGSIVVLSILIFISPHDIICKEDWWSPSEYTPPHRLVRDGYPWTPWDIRWRLSVPEHFVVLWVIGIIMHSNQIKTSMTKALGLIYAVHPMLLRALSPSYRKPFVFYLSIVALLLRTLFLPEVRASLPRV